MAKINVIVNGALGRMGQQVVAAISGDQDLELVGAVDIKAKQDVLHIPFREDAVPLRVNLESLLSVQKADVLVDFSVPDAALNVARTALGNKLHLVIGTTGLTDANINEIGSLAKQHKKGAIIAANFAIGAVILMHLAKIASRYFDVAEIIELHHDKKLDAPSGTALATADMMVKGRGSPFRLPSTEKETLKGTRGGEKGGISIHSVRLTGLVASQEVIFGALGQTLSLRHDTISRESFMPGVIMAIKKVTSINGVVYGLDSLLDLGD